MENDLQPNSTAGVTGKRKRDHGFVPCSEEEDLNVIQAENHIKVSRQWQQQAQPLVRNRDSSNSKQQGSYTRQGYHHSQPYPHAPPVVVMDNWSQMQQQQVQTTDFYMAAATANHVTPALNMKQKSMAAAMLRDLRSISPDPSKLFLQCQLQQQQEMKYGNLQQLQPCLDPTTQLSVVVPSTARSQLLQHQEYSPSCLQSAQSPQQLPTTQAMTPLVQTSQINYTSELDFRNNNGSPTSSSSSPYPNFQNVMVSHNCNNPVGVQQLPEVELSSVNQNGGGAMSQCGSPNQFLQQGSHSLKNIPPRQQQQQQQQQQSTMLQHPPSQQQVVHQQPANPGMQNGSQNGLLQNHGSRNGLSQNGLLQNGLRNGMWNGLQGGLQNGMMQQQQQQQQGNRCLQQNGAIQQQSGPYATQHLPGHLSQNGIQNRPPQQETFSGGGNSVTMLHESQTLVMMGGGGSWHPSVAAREPSSCVMYTETQQANGSSNKSMHLQRMPDRPPSTSGSSVPEFGTQAASAAAGVVPMSPGQQLGQCQGIIHRNGDDTEQESSKAQFEMHNNNNPSLLPVGSTTKSSCPLPVASRLSKVQQSLQSEAHGRRLVQGSYCSSSSSGVEPPPPAFINTNSNEGPNNNLSQLQGAGASCPPKLVRSFTKVYKLGSITRAINVNQFSNYEELRGALACMFNLECQLDQDLGWKLVFLDNEDDLLLVGDDPWEVFVSTVRAIRILSPAEVSFCMRAKEEESVVCL
ncbi:unnamed protein product [Sphagnum jensenii]|uniref:Auxin-responsive protein n=1 Tax=Sphagnum jensenii TaxID=128206 RepID=A0ABP0ZYX5_9BRYO